MSYPNDKAKESNDVPEGFFIQDPQEVSELFDKDLRSKLGFGEYRSPSCVPADMVGKKALELFLLSLDRLAPEVKERLRDDVRPFFRAAVRTENAKESQFSGYSELRQLAAQKRKFPKHKQLDDAVLDWARRFYLHTDRMLETAVATLRSWEGDEPLYEEVLPVYREVAGQHGLLFLGESSKFKRIKPLLRFLESPSSEWKTAIQALQNWARAHRAETSSLVLAVFKLDAWSSLPNPTCFQWATPGPLRFVLDGPEYFKFSTVGWCPNTESRSKAQKRIRDAFKAKLKKHLDDIGFWAEHEGLKRTPLEWRPEDFDWLVLYQVKGLNLAEIVRNQHEAGNDEQILESARKTVPNRIDHAAQLTAGPCWKEWLRPKQRGAPQKTRDG